MKSTSKAIPNIFLNKASKLTSITEDNYKIIIIDHCSGHILALTKSGLNMKTFSTLKLMW